MGDLNDELYVDDEGNVHEREEAEVYDDENSVRRVEAPVARKSKRKRTTFFGDPWSNLALGFALLPYLALGSCKLGLMDEPQYFLWASGLACIGVLLGIVRFRRTIAARIALFIGVLPPALTYFLLTADWTAGRPLRRKKRVRIPPLAKSNAWLMESGKSLAAPLEAAAGWRREAAAEAASVATFSHFALELMSLGAPPGLVANAHHDALDEIEHARLAYSIAHAIDGRARGAGPFPEATWSAGRKLTLGALAAECAVEACVLEAAAAHVAGQLATHDGLSPRIAATLRQISEDEARHAEHGQEVIRWAVASGGPSVIDVARNALRAFNCREFKSAHPDGLERFGLAGTRQWQRATLAAKREALVLFDDLERNSPTGHNVEFRAAS